MHWYYPPTPTLRPLEPATWEPWQREVRAAPPVRFDRSAVHALLGHVAAALADPMPYRDDPGPRWQREGVAGAVPPFHEVGHVVGPCGWAFEWPFVPVWPWHDDPDLWWFDLPTEVERAQVGNELGVPPGTPVLVTASGRVSVGPHVIVVEPYEDEDLDADERFDALVQGLTGWVGVDRSGHLVGPFTCPACGASVGMDWDWAPGDPLECLACEADVFSVRRLPRPGPAAVPPRRWIDVLVELGAVDLAAPPDETLVRAVEGARARGAVRELVALLLASATVDDVYGDDAALRQVMEAW